MADSPPIYHEGQPSAWQEDTYAATTTFIWEHVAWKLAEDLESQKTFLQHTSSLNNHNYKPVFPTGGLSQLPGFELLMLSGEVYGLDP